MSQPEDALWQGQTQQKTHIDELRIFNVRQPYPLLLAAKRALSAGDFTTVLRACAIISCAITPLAVWLPTTRERANAVAVEIAVGKLTGYDSIVRALRTIYPSDEQFRNAFAEKQLRTVNSRNRRLVRYILFKLESHLTGQEYDVDSSTYSIEHILPENPDSDWPQFSDLQVEQNVYRLGNMTLLSADRNRNLGNKDFAEKRKAYADSKFEITLNISRQ
ncbi:MAG: DUF1524 domain-containing protein [Caldilineaceae bacterium]